MIDALSELVRTLAKQLDELRDRVAAIEAANARKAALLRPAPAIGDNHTSKV